MKEETKKWLEYAGFCLFIHAERMLPHPRPASIPAAGGSLAHAVRGDSTGHEPLQWRP